MLFIFLLQKTPLSKYEESDFLTALQKSRRAAAGVDGKLKQHQRRLTHPWPLRSSSSSAQSAPGSPCQQELKRSLQGWWGRWNKRNEMQNMVSLPMRVFLWISGATCYRAVKMIWNPRALTLSLLMNKHNYTLRGNKARFRRPRMNILKFNL